MSRRGDELWKIKNIRVSTCVNTIINQDHRQLDIVHVSSMIWSLVKSEVSILVTDL